MDKWLRKKCISPLDISQAMVMRHFCCWFWKGLGGKQHLNMAIIAQITSSMIPLLLPLRLPHFLADSKEESQGCLLKSSTTFENRSISCNQRKIYPSIQTEPRQSCQQRLQIKPCDALWNRKPPEINPARKWKWQSSKQPPNSMIQQPMHSQ